MNIAITHIKRIFAKIFGKKDIAQELKQAIIQERRNRCKLGVSYNVFDGIELLDSSLRSIRNNVCYINVVYQSISNFGESAPKEDVDEILRLEKIGLIDKVIFYTPKLNDRPHNNETAKRNIGLQDCKKNGCTHFLCMDTDEFYRDKEFKEAKNFIIDNKITASACQLYLYVKSPKYRTEQPDPGMFVPFICKINKFSRIKFLAKRFCLTDPTRMVASFSNKIWVFAPQKICMHHMSLVRKDLQLKFRNSTFNEGTPHDKNDKNLYAMNWRFPSKFRYGENELRVIEVEDEFCVGDFDK